MFTMNIQHCCFISMFTIWENIVPLIKRTVRVGSNQIDLQLDEVSMTTPRQLMKLSGEKRDLFFSTENHFCDLE